MYRGGENASFELCSQTSLTALAVPIAELGKRKPHWICAYAPAHPRTGKILTGTDVATEKLSDSVST